MSTDSRLAFDEVMRCLQTDTLEHGLALCRAKLGQLPDDASLTALLGAILLKSGSVEEAERHLGRAIELEPGFAKPYEDLGALYLGRNEAEKSIAFFEKALELDSTLVTAGRGLAVALQRCGRTADANAVGAKFGAAVAGRPAVGQADVLYRAGNATEAQRLCEEALRQEPDNIACLHLLAVIATDDERFNDAEAMLRRIIDIKPESAPAARDLARFLGLRGRFQEAIEMLQDATRPGDPDIQLALGDMLAIVGRSADALTAYDACLVERPAEPGALLGRAHMLRIVGRADEALEAYRHCVAACPDMGDARWYLASMGRNVATDEDVAAMKRQSGNPDIPAESRVAFNFALARAFEQRNDFKSAWKHYQQGNVEQRGLIKYDPVKTEVATRDNKAVFTKQYFTGNFASTPTAITPIFIVGMPRSGSTLIEQILASHSRVSGLGELPYIIMMSTALAANRTDGAHYPDLMRDLDTSQLNGLGRSYLRYTSAHNDQKTPCFTDKMPANFTHIGFIRQILPHAKIIDARRDPMATCVANYRQLFAKGKNQSYDLTELGEYYLQYIDLMKHWDEVLPDFVLRVQYEDVVADLDSQVRRLLEFCALPFEEACINFHRSERPVNTASAEQVRQPLYQTGVEFWKNYEPFLDELREVLGPVL